MKWIIIALAALAAGAQAQPAPGGADKALPACAVATTTLDPALRERFMALATAVFDAREAGMQAPPDTVRVIAEALRQDLVRRSVYVSCDGLSFYVQDRGGLRDEVRWYGPLAISALPDTALVAAVAEQERAR